MHLHYSPYFNGHTYINYSAHPEHHGGLMGESIESTEGLLSRLELMSGKAYPDETDTFKQQRALEYCAVLQDKIKEGKIKEGPLTASIGNDKLKFKDDGVHYDLPKCRLNVSTELLRWRDTLILAGWDKKTALPGKLQVISDAEQHIPADSTVLRGTADRWYDLKQNLANHLSLITNHLSHITIQVYQPQVLVEPLIQTIIDLVNPSSSTSTSSFYPELPANHLSLITNHLSILKFSELYQAYEWLTQQPPTPGQVIVCSDSQRLDNVLRCHHLPITTGDAEQGCHHVISDIRSYLDTPQSLIWLDCNGDYGFHYPYDFISASEKADLQNKGITIPTEQTMLSAVHSHIIHQLNQIQGNVILISSTYDTATQLPQHPMVASALFHDGEETKIPVSTPDIPIKKNVGKQINFTPQLHYDIHKDARVSSPVMSYSALTQLIQYPFNFVTERELHLYEPYDQQDVKTEKGNVAHRVVRFLVNYANSTDLNITSATYDKYFEEACTLEDDHTTKYKSILLDDENKFELEDLKYTLRDSIKSLSGIIRHNHLSIIDSEAEIPQGAKASKKSVNLQPFGDSKAYIDLILQKNGTHDYYIFDFKYSLSTSHPDKLEEGKSIQFAFYKEIFEQHYQGGGKTLKGIGYYLFPLHTLYVPDNLNGGITGSDVKTVRVSPAAIDTLKSMAASYKFRMGTEQLTAGHIEEGEDMKIDSVYDSVADRFPLETKYHTEDIKGSPYTQCHIVLKNQIR